MTLIQFQMRVAKRKLYTIVVKMAELVISVCLACAQFAFLAAARNVGAANAVSSALDAHVVVGLASNVAAAAVRAAQAAAPAVASSANVVRYAAVVVKALAANAV
jgi:hypothetical protein